MIFSLDLQNLPLEYPLGNKSAGLWTAWGGLVTVIAALLGLSLAILSGLWWFFGPPSVVEIAAAAAYLQKEYSNDPPRDLEGLDKMKKRTFFLRRGIEEAVDDWQAVGIGGRWKVKIVSISPLLCRFSSISLPLQRRFSSIVSVAMSILNISSPLQCPFLNIISIAMSIFKYITSIAMSVLECCLRCNVDSQL